MINRKSTPLSKVLFSFVYIFMYAPILMLVIYSFNLSPPPSAFSSFTIQWYKELFYNVEIWLSFFNSIIVAVSASLICFIFSTLLIYYKTVGGKVSGIIPLFYGNLMIPDVVLALSLVTFFSMLNIGLGLTTVTIAHSILGLGFSIPLMSLRFKDLNPTLLEASAILGASSWTTFRRIVLPFMMPVLLGSGLMVFILSFDDFILAYFCAGSSAQTLSLFLVASLRYGVSPVINALSTFVLLFTILITTLIFLLKRKEEVETC